MIDLDKSSLILTEKVGKKQYIIPYLMSCHPGATLKRCNRTC